MNREYNIRVRLTKNEYDLLLREADKEGYAKNGELNLSSYIRGRLFSEMLARKNTGKELRELSYQIRKIGVNINQAVKRINSGREGKDDDTYLLTELAEVERLLKKYEKVLGENTWQ